jgi:hypothetical protein
VIGNTSRASEPRNPQLRGPSIRAFSYASQRKSSTQLEAMTRPEKHSIKPPKSHLMTFIRLQLWYKQSLPEHRLEKLPATPTHCGYYRKYAKWYDLITYK